MSVIIWSRYPIFILFLISMHMWKNIESEKCKKKKNIYFLEIKD